MRTRGERRRLTARAIKRKWSRYLATQGLLVDGMYPSSNGVWVRGEMRPCRYLEGEMIQASRYHMIGVEWRPVHKDQLQPHRMNKKHIDNSPDHWPGRRHNMDWDAPTVHDWDDDRYCDLGSAWVNQCTCDECAYMDYLSFDPFDDWYDLGEYLMWDAEPVEADELPPEEDTQYWLQFWEEE